MITVNGKVPLASGSVLAKVNSVLDFIVGSEKVSVQVFQTIGLLEAGTVTGRGEGDVDYVISTAPSLNDDELVVTYSFHRQPR